MVLSKISTQLAKWSNLVYSKMSKLVLFNVHLSLQELINKKKDHECIFQNSFSFINLFTSMEMFVMRISKTKKLYSIFN